MVGSPGSLVRRPVFIILLPLFACARNHGRAYGVGWLLLLSNQEDTISDIDYGGGSGGGGPHAGRFEKAERELRNAEELPGTFPKVAKVNRLERRPRASNGQGYPQPCCTHFGNLKYARQGKGYC